MLTISGRKPFRMLHPGWQLLSPPACEPISVIEAKRHARRDLIETIEDDTWGIMITGARDAVETDTMRAIVWQRWKLILDEWPDTIEGFKCPLVAIESVKYLDFTTPTAVQTTVDPTTYAVSGSEPWRVTPAFTKYWLPPRPQLASIEITFTAGYLVPFTVSGSTLSFIDYVPTNGTSFRLTNSGGVLPSPLVANTTYYVISSTATTCQLSLTSGGAAITLTSVGSGLQFLGTMPGGIRMAMLKHMAINFADREGSMAAADCERSYYQSLRSSLYTVI